MSRIFDAFLYVPTTPPATPLPVKPKVAGCEPCKSPPLEAGPSEPMPLQHGRKRQWESSTMPPRRSERLAWPSIIKTEPNVKTESSDSLWQTSASAECAEDKSEQEQEQKKKKKKPRPKARPYADPSCYAHLPQHLADVVTQDLTLLMVGLNPGVMTATTGHHFANPTNLFWPLLYTSGLIAEPLKAHDSACLPARYGIGITNIVARPTAEAGELSRQECLLGASATISRVQALRPKAVAFTGKGIWEAVFAAIHGRPLRKSDAFAFGWQAETIIDPASGWTTRIFVTMGTSGRVAAYSPTFKRQVFAQLGAWVCRERATQQQHGLTQQEGHASPQT